MQQRFSKPYDKLVNEDFFFLTGNALLQNESLDYVQNSFDISKFLFNTYQQNFFLSEEENIKKLTHALTQLFTKLEILKIDLRGEVTINSITDLNKDYLPVNPIKSWKFKALCKALEKNNTILEFSLINHLIDEENASSFSNVLKVNNHIKILHIHNDIYTSRMVGEILADGIKHNHGLTKIVFEALKSYDAIDFILEAVKFNKNIIDLGYFEDYSLQNEREQNLANFIATNNHLVDLTTAIWTQNLGANASHLKAAISKNNNLNTLSDWNLEYDLDNISHTEYTMTRLQKYDYFRHMILDSKYLEKVPYYGNTNSTIGIIPYLLQEKSNLIHKLVDFFNSLDFTSKPAPHYIKWFIEYEKIGKVLLKEKLKKVNWENNEVIIKYAKLNDITELNNYNFSKDFSAFSQEQLNSWEYIFKQFVSLIDTDEEKLACSKLNMIELYHNTHFLHLKGVCKDVNKLEHPISIWSIIASYSELEHPHPSLISDDYEAVIEDIYMAGYVNMAD